MELKRKSKTPPLTKRLRVFNPHSVAEAMGYDDTTPPFCGAVFGHAVNPAASDGVCHHKSKLEEAVAKLADGGKEGNISGTTTGVGFGRGGTQNDVRYISMRDEKGEYANERIPYNQ